MPYDLFISYSRRDNIGQRVTELVERIATDYLQFSGEELSSFFDKHEIHGMDDWRHRILDGLRQSQLFLLVLSPEYLKSPYCEWEVVEYLKYESARAVLGEGMAPIYFVTIPGLDEPGFEQRAAAWFSRVRRRQHFDLRPWFEAGRQALENQDVRTRLEDLERSLHTRLSRLRRIASAPGNLPAHNPRFVGRETEMRALHEAAGLGQLGVISAVYGIGGLGKTALAIQYAFAYADFYPSGRWLIGCAGMPGLAAAIRTLDADLGVEFTDNEKLDDTRAARRILESLHERAERGATARADEPNAPQLRALLILDNIDDARLLHPPHTDLLSGRTWLHVLATTRLGPQQLSPDEVRHRLLAVDELPADDALRLIESYQPQGRFASDDERTAARGILTLLQGFTLAVEVVAVHLAERGGRLTCAALRDRLAAEGLTGLENIADKTTRGIPHVERLVTVTLAPTLATLSEPESLVLTLAALLPPDHIPLPWLRDVAAATFPDIAQDTPPGYDDPWLTLVNHLISLRLLQVVELAPDGQTPRLCRIHRLVQEVVKQTRPEGLDGQERGLLNHIRSRARFLWDGWVQHEHRWEVAPLIACADHWLARDSDAGPWLATEIAVPLQQLGAFAAAERLNRVAVVRTYPSDPNYAARLSNLAGLLRDTNRLGEAEPLVRRALVINEASYGPDHPEVATALNNLAALFKDANRLAEAEPLCRRALAIDEAWYGPDHPNVAIRLNNLAALLKDTNHTAEAESLYRRALKIWEKSQGPDHPNVATALNNLALLLKDTNRRGEAEPLYRRSLMIDEASYGPDHADVARDINNLAALFHSTNRLTEAEPLYRRTLDILLQFNRTTGHEHPNLRAAIENYRSLLAAMGQTPEQIRARLDEIGRPFAMSLGDLVTKNAE
jgi:tetratricopeptide (TPR) repeat protein